MTKNKTSLLEDMLAMRKYPKPDPAPIFTYDEFPDELEELQAQNAKLKIAYDNLEKINKELVQDYNNLEKETIMEIKENTGFRRLFRILKEQVEKANRWYV